MSVPFGDLYQSEVLRLEPMNALVRAMRPEVLQAAHVEAQNNLERLKAEVREATYLAAMIIGEAKIRGMALNGEKR